MPYKSEQTLLHVQYAALMPCSVILHGAIMTDKDTRVAKKKQGFVSTLSFMYLHDILLV